MKWFKSYCILTIKITKTIVLPLNTYVDITGPNGAEEYADIGLKIKLIHRPIHV